MQGAALTVFLVVLQRLGMPGALEIDALWVREHTTQVRVLFACLAVAVLAFVGVLWLRHHVRMSAGVLLGGAALSGLLFWQRLSILIEVLRNHVFDV